MSEDQEVKRTFQVEIERVKRHVFIVDDVNSQEEAEEVAEEWLLDGEEGAILEEEITAYDSYPIDSKEDIN
jgi:hypothetical protein